MAHFAEIDVTNKVTQVIVVHNNELLVDGVESEVKGIAFCQSLFGGTWIQTSYNNLFRGHFAIIGDTYDPGLDVFIKEKLFDSWVLDEKIGTWNPPITRPSYKEGFYWVWDEETINWKSIQNVTGE